MAWCSQVTDTHLRIANTLATLFSLTLMLKGVSEEEEGSVLPDPLKEWVSVSTRPASLKLFF